MSEPKDQEPNAASQDEVADRTGAPSRAREKAADFEWLHRVRGGSEKREGKRPLPVVAPRVVVCDDGELADVIAVLGSLDHSVLRVKPSQVEDLLEWERPTHLFLTTVRVGLSHPLRLAVSAEGPVSIAVADSDSQTTCTAMLRRGFRYVVRRPVHPEALRLLLMQVLYSGPEHRLVARFPFGADVRWRSGLRKGSCAMTEISAHGCRLLTNQSFALQSRIYVRVPAVLADSRDLRLRGRVVRRELLEREDKGPRTQVAVQFEGLSGRAQAHLDALLAECASGPAAMRDRRAPAGDARPGRRGRSGFRFLTVEPELPPLRSFEEDPDAPEKDRRRRMRGLWQHEVVALDDESEDVRHVLLGADLSPGGLRVEPHPLLRIGDRLKLALYDANHEPLVVRARVAHEDGRRGWGLVFEDLEDEARERLEAMVSELPPVAALSDDDDKPHGVVLGEIRAVEDAKPRS